MKNWIPLHVVVRYGSMIFKLNACKNHSLLIWRDPFSILDLLFEFSNSVSAFHHNLQGLASQCLDNYIKASSYFESNFEEASLLITQLDHFLSCKECRKLTEYLIIDWSLNYTLFVLSFNLLNLLNQFVFVWSTFCQHILFLCFLVIFTSFKKHFDSKTSQSPILSFLHW